MSSEGGSGDTSKQIIDTFKVRRMALRSRITPVFNGYKAVVQDPKALYEDMVITKHHVRKYEMDLVKHKFPEEHDLALLVGR